MKTLPKTGELEFKIGYDNHGKLIDRRDNKTKIPSKLPGIVEPPSRVELETYSLRMNCSAD
jgi:hypothetical protein